MAARPARSSSQRRRSAVVNRSTGIRATVNKGRPHRSLKYQLAFDHGWDIVEEYELNYGTPAASHRAIAKQFRSRGINMSACFVQKTLRRFQESGDPTQLARGGSTANQANVAERLWMKAKLREQPDLYFFELHAKFVGRWGWAISDAMISQALHFEGAGPEDAPLTLKVLEALARQRNAELRRECLEALTGPGALPECYIIMDESSMDRRTLRRRRGWAPRGLPAKLYEHFEVKGSAKLQSLLSAVNSDGFVLDACQLVEGGRNAPCLALSLVLCASITAAVASRCCFSLLVLASQASVTRSCCFGQRTTCVRTSTRLTGDACRIPSLS
jgi:hypothetical protein